MNKRSRWGWLLIACVLLGALAGCGAQEDDSVVGAYQTDFWNGEQGTLVLYKDGSCQYPSGGAATWKRQGDTILITMGEKEEIPENGVKRLVVFVDEKISDAEARTIGTRINVLENIEECMYQTGDDARKRCFYVTLSSYETDGSTTQRILADLPGVTNVAVLEVEPMEPDVHEAKIVGKGLILHEKFFKKVSD